MNGQFVQKRTSRLLPVFLLGMTTFLLSLVLAASTALMGWYFAVVAISLLLPIALISYNYRIGIYLFILLLPYSGSAVLPKLGPFSVTNLILIGVLLSFLFHWSLSNSKRVFSTIPFSKEVLLLYIVPITFGAIIGTFRLHEIPDEFLAAQNFESYGIQTYWISLYLKKMLVMGVVLAAAGSVIESNNGKHIAIVTIASGVLYALAIFTVVIGSGVSLEMLRHDRGFLGVLGVHNNDAGMLLLMPFAVSLFLRISATNTLQKFALSLASLLMFVAVVLTFSRAAFLGAMVIVVYHIFRTKSLRLLLAATALLVVAAAIAPTVILERLATGLKDGDSISTQLTDITGVHGEFTAGRVWIWSQRLDDVMHSPILGNGLASGQWSQIVKSGYNYLADPHNVFLAILTDLGIVGLLLFVLFYRYLWRLFNELAVSDQLNPVVQSYFAGSAAHLIAIVVNGMTRGDYTPGFDNLFLWPAIGAAIGYRIRNLNYDKREASTKSKQLPV